MEEVPFGMSQFASRTDYDTAVRKWRAGGEVEVHCAETPPEFVLDTDGELLIDWSPAPGRMVTLSLRADGRLSYAFVWDGEKSHGTAQMPAGKRGE